MGNQSSSHSKANAIGTVTPSKRGFKKTKKQKSSTKILKNKDKKESICSRPLLSCDKIENATFSPMGSTMNSFNNFGDSMTPETVLSYDSNRTSDDAMTNVTLNLSSFSSSSGDSEVLEPTSSDNLFADGIQFSPTLFPAPNLDSEPSDVAGIYHGNGVGSGKNDDNIIDENSSIQSESLLSCYSTDLESIGNMSADSSLSNLSLSSSIASLDLKRKKRRPQLQDSRLSCSNLRLSGKKIKRRTSNERPTAQNAFETLPRHLIKTALIRQATSTLRDERFVKRRITKLCPIPAAKIHVSDLAYLQKRDIKDAQQRENLKEGATIPLASTYRDGECSMSIMLESFDLFQKCTLELCSIQMVNLSIDFKLPEDGAADCDKIPVASEKSKSESSTISLMDAGKAIYLLGKYVHGKELHEEAIGYYRSALFLLLLELGIQEPCLLDESDDCSGFFYVQIANAVVNTYSPVHKDIATLLTKMGDVHGKNDEVNDALHSYRASQVFWTRYLSEKKITSIKDCECVADMSDLDDHAAAVEGLALTHNRIGGVYCSKGDLGLAVNSFNEALEMQLKALGPDHLEVAKTLHNIGVSHRHSKDLDQALEYYHKALRIFELNLGKEHLDTGKTNIFASFVSTKQKARSTHFNLVIAVFSSYIT